jgi:hypothetical protein
VDTVLLLLTRWTTGSYVWDARYVSAVTTSPIRGRCEACSWRHMAATARAWYNPLVGYRPSSIGSAIWENFLRSLNKGRALKTIRKLFQDFHWLSTIPFLKVRKIALQQV